MVTHESDDMPNSCYVFIHASPGARVGLVKKGAPGWLITSVDQKDMSDADARKVAELLHRMSSQDGAPPPPAATTERKNP